MILQSLKQYEFLGDNIKNDIITMDMANDEQN